MLVGLWEGPGEASLAVWVGAEPSFPSAVYGIRRFPRLEEHTETREWISGRQLAIEAFRVSLRGTAPRYYVGAYWALDDGRWMNALAYTGTRTVQEEFLVCVRTLQLNADTSE
jgi:hypothetical protein